MSNIAGFGGGNALIADEGLIQQPGRRGVFVSHASEDAELARAFSNLIHDVTAGMIPTFSSSSKDQGVGIPYGDDWFKWIEARIGESGNVVALITPASIGRPWILFEAGFGRAIEGVRVFGLRLGASGEDAYVGPFKAFQNSASAPDDLLKLCKQLFEGTACSPRDEMVLAQIDQFLLKVKAHSSHTNAIPGKANAESEAFFKALEEMKMLAQAKSAERLEDWDDKRTVDMDYLFHLSISSRREIEPAIRATLLLGIASELGMRWIIPTIQYALEHPIQDDKYFSVLIDMVRSSRHRRLPFPPEMLIGELVEAVNEHQRKRFRRPRDRAADKEEVDPS